MTPNMKKQSLIMAVFRIDLILDAMLFGHSEHNECCRKVHSWDIYNYPDLLISLQ